MFAADGLDGVPCQGCEGLQTHEAVLKTLRILSVGISGFGEYGMTPIADMRQRLLLVIIKLLQRVPDYSVMTLQAQHLHVSVEAEALICNLLRPLIKILFLLVPYVYILVTNKKNS